MNHHRKAAQQLPLGLLSSEVLAQRVQPSAATCHSNSCPSSSSLASRETPLPYSCAKSNTCLYAMLSTRDQYPLRMGRYGGTRWDGTCPGSCNKLNVSLVFQISNVSFFVLSAALLYLNRQYCQQRAVPMYFVSGLLLCVGECQHHEIRQVDRVPDHLSMIPLALETGF